MQLIFEKSIKGRRGFRIAKNDVKETAEFPEQYCRKKDLQLPEVSELDVVRHYTNLSKRNFCIDTNFCPLGSCTMKYNPKFTEKIAKLEGFLNLHPLLAQFGDGILAQGCLEVIYETEKLLCEITAMDAFTMLPLAGAHAEFTGIMLIAEYHKQQGKKRRFIIIPDSAHGTNPASAATADYDVIVMPTNRDGCMDFREFKHKLNDKVAAVMLTSPNTLGIFNPRIKEICDAAHKVGALMYYDGANLNAILGKCRPGDIGFDIVHLNLHKTFSSPHGGGGPGAGPLGVNEKLTKFLPVPRIEKQKNGNFALNYHKPASIGCIAPFYGNFGVILRSYAYLMLLGKSGLKRVSDYAVLNANYCRALLKKYFEISYDRICMHEFVLSANRQKKMGVSALDIAKFLIDKGFHPPTVYFPLIVQEAMMIEPSESESKQTLDSFVEAMQEAAKLAETEPQTLKDAPQTTPVRRLNETKAARELRLRWPG
ncbi:MAG: aminomethyl-transferring glycine dehydrogenase subunit GcvPB [Candidatus Omnitrophica bacterium]|nr:aminomethyl-transferring glycine dehydrogenase subunit GcvPB [Candidatus Omnitrophota bacterium]